MAAPSCQVFSAAQKGFLVGSKKYVYALEKEIGVRFLM